MTLNSKSSDMEYVNKPRDLFRREKTMSKVVVAGVGMTPFSKPGASGSYDHMGAEATRLALADAGVEYAWLQQAYVGYVYGDSTSGQKALYGLGMTGLPVFNVSNNCSTGSTALYLARQAVQSGAAACVLALEFEEMKLGAIDMQCPVDLRGTDAGCR